MRAHSPNYWSTPEKECAPESAKGKYEDKTVLCGGCFPARDIVYRDIFVIRIGSFEQHTQEVCWIVS